ncbi:MAG: hypothetical protein NTW87_09460 [Planctomycetota bacterium]|nr:hypothetical protein [Planctomycetota bacterium]
MHFEEKSAVQKSLHRIALRLDELGVPYAIAGGMAMFLHGYRRFTEDVDILVAPDGLKTLHARLEGLGYVPPFAGSKNLRDTETGVRIEFLVTGGYPGDGKPKPVAFPDPAEANTRIKDMSCLRLEKLVELKLASGMTNVLRAKDIGDVIALIEQLRLGEDFAARLHPYVREKYLELWRAVEDARARGEE